VELCLAALVLGALVAGLWLMPIWPNHQLDIPVPAALDDMGLGASGPNSYEVGATAVIVAMTTAAAYRAPSFRRQAAFLASAVYGMATAFVYFRPHENLATPTFVLNFLSAAVATFVLAGLPKMFTVLAAFWGLRGRQRPGGPSPLSEAQQDTPATPMRGFQDQAGPARDGDNA
jgi:hypothetical protein